VKYRTTRSTEPDWPGDVNYKQLLAKAPQDVEAEYNILNARSERSTISTDVAAAPRYKYKNRYANTLPCTVNALRHGRIFHLTILVVDDYNRVTIRSGDSSGYINASFIEVSAHVGKTDRFARPKSSSSDVLVVRGPAVRTHFRADFHRPDTISFFRPTIFRVSFFALESECRRPIIGHGAVISFWHAFDFRTMIGRISSCPRPIEVFLFSSIRIKNVVGTSALSVRLNDAFIKNVQLIARS